KPHTGEQYRYRCEYADEQQRKPRLRLRPLYERLHRLHFGDQKMRIELCELRADGACKLRRITLCSDSPSRGNAVPYKAVHEVDLLSPRLCQGSSALVPDHTNDLDPFRLW